MILFAEPFLLSHPENCDCQSKLTKDGKIHVYSTGSLLEVREVGRDGPNVTFFCYDWYGMDERSQPVPHQELLPSEAGSHTQEPVE